MEEKLESVRIRQLDPEISDKWEYLLKVHREEKEIRTRIDELIEEWEAASEREKDPRG